MSNQRRTFGSIRKLSSGRFQARYRDRRGHVHTAPRTFARRPDAEKFLAVTEADLVRGTWMNPDLAKTEFEDLVVAWRSSRPNLRASTAATVASYLNTLLFPYFGGMRAGDITIDAVRAWHAWAISQPRYPNQRNNEGEEPRRRSPNTIAKAYRILKAIMESAVDDGIIARNPCRLRGVASDRTPEQKVATPNEVERLADSITPSYRAMVLVAAYGGLRLGELAALQRNRISWKGNTIRVVEQVTQVSGQFIVGPPKTDAGVRTISMPVEVMEELRAHVAEYSENGSTGLVFPAPNGGHIRRSNFYRRVWTPACKKAGVPGLRFHDLRHTHATIAVAIGVDTRTLMARMGHASARAALMYQHAQSDQPIADGFSKVIATAKADAATTAAEAASKATEADDSGVQSPSAPDDSGTFVARNGLRAVE